MADIHQFNHRAMATHFQVRIANEESLYAAQAAQAALDLLDKLESHLSRFRANSDIAQLAAIRAGFGIGMCQVAVASRDPDLVRVLPDLVSVELGLWIVMHEDLKTSARCKAVFDALVDGLSVP